jgi:hypothetical protein
MGGHPYLAQRGLYELASGGATLTRLEADAASEHWIFGEHLRRIGGLVRSSEELTLAVQALLAGRPCESRDSFYRLRSAGVLKGDTMQEAALRCGLYGQYFRHEFTSAPPPNPLNHASPSL